MILEADVEQYLRDRIKDLGGETRKVKWIGRRGAPDRRCMTTYGCVWVEVKKPGERLADHQRREHERMVDQGERTIVVDSFDSVDRFVCDLVTGQYQ